MRKLELEEIKKLQLEILDDITDFCKQNDIKFWIDYGTLLGAVRHKGYIPWDDDVDIGMLREDYDRFIHSYNQRTNSNYSVHTVELDKNYVFPYAKVHDDRTVLYSDDVDMPFSINVDVFPYDIAPAREKKYLRMYRQQERLSLLHVLRNAKTHETSGNIVKRLATRIIMLLLKLVPANFFAVRRAKTATKCKEQDSPYITLFVASFGRRADKHIFDEMIELPFEDRIYPAPKRYDDWLTLFYGDYMTPPPEDKRGTNHHYKAYMKQE